ncbi:hypothetical protein [Nonomuraea typhae]|uniref:hypothetical protein n=1 Tax=Nonomuraea typhae TaxID=2603600 RepID=UPI0012F8217E|nr:hypothetical protein [Nonomuraea typhae]
MLGDDWLWMATTWSPPADVPGGFSTLTTVALLVAALVKAAYLWLILRAPVRGALDGRAKALRALLYLAVVYALVLWSVIVLLPDVVYPAFQLALWTAINVLYLLVIRWRSRVLRTAAGAMFAVGLAGMTNGLLEQLDLPALEWSVGVELSVTLGGVAATVLTVVGQRRDGRWSRGTQVAGWSSAGFHTLMVPLNFGFGSVYSGDLALPVLINVVGLVDIVWFAATARELPLEGSPVGPPPVRRVIRVAVAAVAVLPIIALIPPEQTPRLTYTGGSAGCYDRPRFGDLKPAEREAMFLCLARSTDNGFSPMFPDSRSDQEILAFGRELCRAKDRDEQKAILTRAGSERPDWGVDSWDLVYVCPEIVGATQPDLLRSTEEAAEAGAAYIAEQNAKCRDPWPKRKGVVQATAKYFLFVDGDHGYLVHDPEDKAADEEAERATDRVYDDGRTLIGVSGSAALVGHLDDISDLCLTVKAFRTAPPRRMAGWDQVTEVPIVSRSGRLTVPYMGEGGEVGAGIPMPNLAIAGKGRYRLRVYVRVDAAGEEHLIVVFPGASEERLKLKP